MSENLTAEQGLEKVMRIMELALLISPPNTECEVGSGRPAVFVSYSLHVSSLDINIYYHGWSRSGYVKRYSIRTNGMVFYRPYLSDVVTDISLDGMIDILENLLTKIKIRDNVNKGDGNSMGSFLYCIVGKSGSGKTTIANKLENAGLKVISSYTTRPPRHKNEKGHIFVDESFFNENRADMVAYDKYNGFEYGVTSEQIEENDVYVINPSGIKYLKNNYEGDKLIVCIYLKTSLKDRYTRMRKRGNSLKFALKRLWVDMREFKDFEIRANLTCKNSNIHDINTVVDKIFNYINNLEKR